MSGQGENLKIVFGNFNSIFHFGHFYDKSVNWSILIPSNDNPQQRLNSDLVNEDDDHNFIYFHVYLTRAIHTLPQERENVTSSFN